MGLVWFFSLNHSSMGPTARAERKRKIRERLAHRIPERGEEVEFQSE